MKTVSIALSFVMSAIISAMSVGPAVDFTSAPAAHVVRA
jgi:hypothetical protein